MHDPLPAVRGLKPEPPASVRPPVEADTEPCEMFDRGRRCVDDPARDFLVAKAGAGCDGIGHVQGRVVVLAHRRRKPALRPQAGGLRAERRFRQQHDRLGRQMQRRHQPGGAAADDDGAAGPR